MEETIQNKMVIKTNNLLVLPALPQPSLSNDSQGFITQTQEFGLGWNLTSHCAKNSVSCQVIWKPQPCQSCPKHGLGCAKSPAHPAWGTSTASPLCCWDCRTTKGLERREEHREQQWLPANQSKTIDSPKSCNPWTQGTQQPPAGALPRSRKPDTKCTDLKPEPFYKNQFQVAHVNTQTPHHE